MLKNAVRFVRTFIDIFNGNRLTRAAAALSYYMTMTFFPVVIVLYTLLGNSYDKAMRIVAFAENLMAEETVSYIRDFLGYVAANNSTAMMIAGLTVLVTSASAAIRSMQFTIGDAQGGLSGNMGLHREHTDLPAADSRDILRYARHAHGQERHEQAQ